ncbi:MAG TPA: hypothetical protein VND22_00525 [Actinomycetota bacterium]|nr:hypothetical protein [Actinomycetota bacterium]
MIAIVSALVVLGTVAFVVLLFVGFSGGVKGVLADFKSPPDYEERTDPRSKLYPILTRSLDSAVSEETFVEFPPEGRHDLCFEGQNNWKIQDGYAYRCDLKITRFYGVTGDLRAALLSLDLSLQSEGFAPVGSRTMAETTDRIGFGTPSTDLLYPPCYQKGDVSLCLKLADRNTQEFSALDFHQRLGGSPTNLDEDADLADVTAVSSQILGAHTYLLSVYIKGTYLEK